MAAVVPLVVPPRRIRAGEAPPLGGPPFDEVAVSGGATPGILEPAGHGAPAGHDGQEQEPGGRPAEPRPAPDEAVPSDALPAAARLGRGAGG